MAASEKGELVPLNVRLPGPSVRFDGYADRCALIERDAVYELAFLDTIAGKCVCRIAIDKSKFFDQLWGGSEKFYRQLRKDTENAPGTPIPPLNTITMDNLPIAQAANLFHISRHETEACFAAYYLSPRIVHEAAQKLKDKQGADTAEPVQVCNVPLNLFVVSGLLESIDRIVSKLNQ